ncbi:MAG: hypothetical protein ACKOX2_02500 [Microcystaceae cyanobacterium]
MTSGSGGDGGTTAMPRGIGSCGLAGSVVGPVMGLVTERPESLALRHPRLGVSSSVC